MKEKIKNTTPIKNDILQALIASGLNGVEMSIALLIYRKTIGWNKKSDKISLSQFTQYIPTSRRSICYAIKTLLLVQVIALVQKGKQNHLASEYAFVENIKKWQLVKKPALVQKNVRTSAKTCTKLVQKLAPTKETLTKETKQKKGEANASVSSSKKKKEELDFSMVSVELVDAFKEFVNHRITIKKPMTQLALEKLNNRLIKFNTQDIISAIDKSIEGGWQGVFTDNLTKKASISLKANKQTRYL
jgi:phage replication O-like protein O